MTTRNKYSHAVRQVGRIRDGWEGVEVDTSLERNGGGRGRGTKQDGDGGDLTRQTVEGRRAAEGQLKESWRGGTRGGDEII